MCSEGLGGVCCAAYDGVAEPPGTIPKLPKTNSDEQVSHYETRSAEPYKSPEVVTTAAQDMPTQEHPRNA